MSARLLQRLPLSLAVPLMVATLLLGLLAASIIASVTELNQALHERIEGLIRSHAYSLTLEVEEHQEADLEMMLRPHISHLMTDPNLSAVLILDAAGKVRIAHRRAWRGQASTELVADLSAQRWHDDVQLPSAPVRWSDAGQLASILIGYNVPVQQHDRVRDLQRGGVYISADLHDARADILRQALRSQLPELIAATVVMLLLGAWLHAHLTRPLAVLTEVSERLARQESDVKAPEVGPPEIARLARSFNRMVDALQHAGTDLRASEERLSTILYSTGEAMIATDTEQRITLLNRVAEDLTGWHEADALGRPIVQVFRIEQADSGRPAEQPVGAVLARGLVTEPDTRCVLVARHGQRRHISHSAAPVRRADGWLAGVVLVFRDTSSAYQLERALADSERHYRTLANAGRLLIWSTDAQDRHLWCNELWQQYTGQSQIEALGLGWLDVIHPDDRPRLISAQQAARQHLQPFSIELRLRRHDGAYRWILNDASPRHDSAGRFIGYIGHGLDISAQHETQQQLQQQLVELRRLQAAMIGREDRILALKAEVNTLLTQQGQPARYQSSEESALT